MSGENSSKFEEEFPKEHILNKIFNRNTVKAHVVAMVIPDEEELMKRATTNQWKGTFKELCSSEDVKTEIEKEMKTAGENAKLLGFQKVKNIFLLSEPMSIENGMLTPSLKSRRAVIEKKFRQSLDNLYNS